MAVWEAGRVDSEGEGPFGKRNLGNTKCDSWDLEKKVEKIDRGTQNLLKRKWDGHEQKTCGRRTQLISEAAKKVGKNYLQKIRKNRLNITTARNTWSTSPMPYEL